MICKSTHHDIAIIKDRGTTQGNLPSTIKLDLRIIVIVNCDARIDTLDRIKSRESRLKTMITMITPQPTALLSSSHDRNGEGGRREGRGRAVKTRLSWRCSAK